MHIFSSDCSDLPQVVTGALCFQGALILVHALVRNVEHLMEAAAFNHFSYRKNAQEINNAVKYPR